MSTFTVTAALPTTLRHLMTCEHAPLPTTHDTALPTLLVAKVTLISKLSRPHIHQPSSVTNNSLFSTTRRFHPSIVGICSKLSRPAPLMDDRSVTALIERP
jgi:hypothetical protein